MKHERTLRMEQLREASVEDVERLARWLGVKINDKGRFRKNWRVVLCQRVFSELVVLAELDKKRGRA